MSDLSVRTVARITGGRLIQNGADRLIEGFSTDSRTLEHGDLFIPLRGENFDGHAFLAQAVSHGAAACLTEEMIGGLTVPVIQVEDTLRALGDLAAWRRRRAKVPLVGITGSSGKTTCKEMLASILSRTGPGLKSPGNFNNLIGVPLTLFKLEPEHRWAVIEMGMSARGEIARLAQIARPDIGIITNVGPAHLERLEGISGVAMAKGELFIHLPPGGAAVINADDPEVSRLPVANGVRKIMFGRGNDADVRAAAIAGSNGSMSFDLAIGEQSRSVVLPLPGQHNVMNALAAAAAASLMDVAFSDIVAGLETFQPSPGRMELVELANDILILDDSYNANPLSVRAALDALHDLGWAGRRIAVLGDMLELGETARELHREIGQIAAEKIDWLLAYGPLAGEVLAGAAEAGMSGDRRLQFDDHGSMATWLTDHLEGGDRVLVKGSRGMQMEKVINLLRAAYPEPISNGN